jgi:hypothetical protein
LKINKENDKDISMEVLYNYFENLSRNNFDDGNIDIDIDVNNPEMDNILNSPITIDEIKNVVKGLKNGKSSGIDGVINEYIKYTIDDMLHIYVLLFIIMLSVNFFCNISSYDILAYITKNYVALIYYAKIVHLLCQFHVGNVGFSAVCQAIYS